VANPASAEGEGDPFGKLKALQNKVSLNDFERRETLHLEEELSDSESSQSSVDSNPLSMDSESEMSEFDAQAFLSQQAPELQSMTSAPSKPVNIVVNSDESWRKLMEVPVKDLLRSLPRMMMPEVKNVVVGPAARPVTSKRANTEIKRPDPYDPKWKTNVFGFRKALRDAFRHMPYLDFVAFMDFLLRSLHRIKDAPGSFTWHSNDPSFRFTMGIRGHNKYTTSLLFKMGFVQMTEEYWIWPS
ncbi:unnamed protein product, partial [Polarella glacialis]